jgi:hypothetical protein
MKKAFILVVVFVLFLTIDSFSQCAMCRASVSSNLSEGRNSIGTGLNIGILYLLVAPYLLVACGVFFYRRAAKKNLREQGLL